MKKVLVSRLSLPMSMQLSHAVMAPTMPPSVPGQFAPKQITEVMCEVLTEANEYKVIKHLETGDIYTIDNSRDITLETPTDEALVVYAHLYNLGINDEFLNMHHYDALTRLYQSDALLSFSDLNKLRQGNSLDLQESYNAVQEDHKALQGDFDNERAKNEKLIQELAEFKAGAQGEIDKFDQAYKELDEAYRELEVKNATLKAKFDEALINMDADSGERYERRKNPDEEGRKWLIWDNKLNEPKAGWKTYMDSTNCDSAVNRFNKVEK